MRVQPNSQSRTPSSIAVAREKFLVDELIDDGVRSTISTSWRRSRDFNVHADRLDLPFVREPNLESPLVMAARPVIEQIAADMGTDPVSVILTSPDGVVLMRAAGHRKLRSTLDDVCLAPGYSYSEEHAGTNGIGTALESRTATLVRGSEHYAECFGSLSCAGAPITHPVSGAVVGALDLTGWVEEGGATLLSLAKSASAQVERRLLELASADEARVVGAYLATCRRSPQLMVIALSGDVLLMNQRLRERIDPGDQSALIELAVDQTLTGLGGLRVATLPGGGAVRLSPITEFCDPEAGMAVFGVHLLDVAEPVVRARQGGRTTSLPGVAGRSSSWQQACDRIARYVDGGEWVVVSGEAGSGRTTSLSAAARRGGGTVRVFSAAGLADPAVIDDLAAEVDAAGFSVVLTDVDKLADDQLTDIAEILARRPEDGWVGATVTGSHPDSFAAAVLLPLFTHTVPIPALRHRIEDLDELVPTLLRQLGRGADLRVSPEAMRQLSRCSWPGNVAELRQTLREVLSRKRSGVIAVSDLPPSCRAVSRRKLTRIESLERDEIVKSLEENGYSKAAAAEALGISRATIYRKIKEFGISR
ncbi:transcriptional regulator of acetoin/glycerol metabolism [Gordonia amarae]|uniref:sigma-54-dependent Fis family transcriptional regulator n=1 Tax=Gordonia amarae TaxID=36821 RepID=UPI0002E002DD|nr:helix-turn-helix domain-containing protein [Gordonia amarae]MCS3877039.1 transcriptional regulator of acetoin/glycerol metabolism [Gordonia amarae]